MRWLRYGVLGLVAVLAVLAGALGWGIGDYFNAGPLNQPTTVVIAKGDSIAQIAATLAAAGIIAHPRAFEVAANLTGAAPGLKAGEYEFPPGISPRFVIELLLSGRVVRHKLTLPEGLTSAEVVGLLNAAPALEGRVEIPPPEGTLLPETYFYLWGERRRGIEQPHHLGAGQAFGQGKLVAHDAAGEQQFDDEARADPRRELVFASLEAGCRAREVCRHLEGPGVGDDSRRSQRRGDLCDAVALGDDHGRGLVQRAGVEIVADAPAERPRKHGEHGDQPEHAVTQPAHLGRRAEDQRCVGAAEAERIAERVAHRALLGLERNEIDVAIGRRILEIERRRHDAVAHGEDREDRLDAAGRAQ